MLIDTTIKSLLIIFFIVIKFIELIDCDYKIKCININPVLTATIVATRPGIIKL